MQVKSTYLTDTNAELKITADAELLQKAKDQALKNLSRSVKVPGFREGKAPQNLIEKHLSSSKLQAEFLDIAINQLYIDAATSEKIRPIGQPNIKISKFVPFDTLEIVAEVEVVGPIKLPDYKKLNVTKEAVKVSPKDIDSTIQELLVRESKKTEVSKPAANGDEVVIDFDGYDSKTKEPVSGASGKDYPLRLGSNTFIPGFEDHLIGLKPGDKKTFEITFPKDYGVKALQSRKVSFEVTINKVQKITLPALDDKFAAKVGPFKTVKELKDDVKKQLETEKTSLAERKYENNLVQKLAERTELMPPPALVENQLEDITSEERRNQTYRGLTWEEYLKSEDLTEESYREQHKSEAELRVKVGLSLAEVAEKENVNVSREELDNQLAQLKQQYTEPEMQTELDKPETRQNIFNRMVTEKTLKLIVGYNQ
ncbi:MAG TPA: trigger factor [Candidatus Binatia bacterium]|nr:trigger factor [Candidatus Binatia bacterium]